MYPYTSQPSPCPFPSQKVGLSQAMLRIIQPPVSHTGDIPRKPAHPQGQPCPSKAKGQLLHPLLLPDQKNTRSNFQLIPQPRMSSGDLWDKIPRKTPN